MRPVPSLSQQRSSGADGRRLLERRILMLGWNAEMYDVASDLGYPVDVYDDFSLAGPGALYAGDWEDARRRVESAPIGCPQRLVIGVASSAHARARAINRLRAWNLDHNFTPWPLISRHAVVSPLATVRPGAFVADCAYVGPCVDVGSWACLLPGAKVCHDSHIGFGSIVVGNAMVLGRARVGRHCWICAAATVLPDAQIADGLVVPVRGLMKRGVSDVSSS